MAFNGTWKMTSSEGVAAFSKSIGTPDEEIAKNMEFGNPDADNIEELNVTADSVTLKVSIGGKVFREATVPIGKESEEVAMDLRPAKHTVTIDGNTITRIQKGAGYEATIKRTVEGDVMTVVMTGPGGAVGTRKYKRV